MLDVALCSLCAAPLGNGVMDGIRVNDVELVAALHACSIRTGAADMS